MFCPLTFRVKKICVRIDGDTVESPRARWGPRCERPGKKQRPFPGSDQRNETKTVSLLKSELFKKRKEWAFDAKLQSHYYISVHSCSDLIPHWCRKRESLVWSWTWRRTFAQLASSSWRASRAFWLSKVKTSSSSGPSCFVTADAKWISHRYVSSFPFVNVVTF